jgi:ABC-2 type transport system permease protein
MGRGSQTLKVKVLNDIIAVAGNEFRKFRRNRTAILISLVVLPLFFTVSLGAQSGGASAHFSPTAQIPVAFVDNDGSVASVRLLQRLVTSGDFYRVQLGYSEDTAVAALGSGRIYAAIVVPKGFQQDLSNNRTTNIVLYADDGEPGLADQVSSTLRSDVQDFNPNVEVRTPQNSNLAGVEIVQKGALFSGFNIGLTVVLGVVQIFATFFEIAGGVSREREDGTLARLLVSPVSLPAILLGKTLFDAVLATIRTFVVLGVSIYLYGARPNTDLGTLLIVSILIALLTMGFGFFVSSLRVGTRAVTIVAFFLILFLFAFSGLIIDKELLRGFSKIISNTLPWAYGFELLKRTVLIGNPLISQAADVAIIGIGAVVFYVTSYLLFAAKRERVAF